MILLPMVKAIGGATSCNAGNVKSVPCRADNQEKAGIK
jgi:hypothetical protein